MINIHDMLKEEFANFIKTELDKEQLLVLDFSYIQSIVEEWWLFNKEKKDFFIQKAALTTLLLNNLREEHIQLFKSLGLISHSIAVISIKNIFKIDEPALALLVHEVLSELFHLTDIQYEYEEHKTLYLKSSAIEYKDWGSGYGEITPHSDDLYENLNVDYLALTVCRDLTKTPTKYFFIKNLLKNFSEKELYQLKDVQAEFVSGKNVSGVLKRIRPVLDYSSQYGFRFFLDFRIDNITGERMKACKESDQYLLDKMRLNLEDCAFDMTTPETGTFNILANYKVLHARGEMELEKEEAIVYSENPNMFNTPRLLYRSKGQRKNYIEILV